MNGMMWLLLFLLIKEDLACPYTGISFQNRKDEEQINNVGSWEACRDLCIEGKVSQYWTWRSQQNLCITMSSFKQQSHENPNAISGFGDVLCSAFRCDPANYDENTICCTDSDGSQCELGEGPCNSDSECSGGLTCARDNCAAWIDDASLHCCGHSTSLFPGSSTQQTLSLIQFASPNRINDEFLYEPNTHVVRVAHHTS